MRKNEHSKYPFLNGLNARQVFAACVASLGGLSFGTVLGWSAPAIPDLRTSGILGASFSNEQKSWIAALDTLGAVLVAPFAGYIADRIGRKMTLSVISIPFCLSWVLIALSSTVMSIYIGRFVTGFCGGVCICIAPIYIGEVSSDSIRGALGSIFYLMFNVGILLSYIVGTFVSWHSLSLMCAGLPLVTLCLLHAIPESPSYLLLCKRNKESACEALKWLNPSCTSASINQKILEMENHARASKGDTNDADQTNNGFLSFCAASMWKPTGICIALFFFQQMSGIGAVCSYTVDIFSTAGSELDAYLCTIIVGVVQVIAVIVSLCVVDKVGRKCVLVSANFISGISLSILGLYFYWKSTDNALAHQFFYLPLVSLTLFIIAFSFGGSIPWLLLGELLPPKLKGPLAGIITAFPSLLSFITIKTYPGMESSLGLFGCYWLYGGCCFVGVIFTIFFVPETKGRSLAEITKGFSNPAFENDTSNYNSESRTSTSHDIP